MCKPLFPIRTNCLLANFCLHPTLPNSNGPPIPLWKLRRPQVCTFLSQFPWSRYIHPLFFCQVVMAHVSGKEDSILIYTNGLKSSWGVGVAAVLGPLTVRYTLPKNASIFVAEVTAINLALTNLALHPTRWAVILSDSCSTLADFMQYSPKNCHAKHLQLSAHALLTASKFVQLC